MSWINNASSIPLSSNTGTLPDMFGALQDWFQPMTFGVITKTVVDFQVIETVVNTQFMGVWQPLTGRKLEMRAQGQRQWNWFMLHADLALTLHIDDIIIYLNKQFRVMADKDYSLYKYRYYELQEDYQNSGPPTP